MQHPLTSTTTAEELAEMLEDLFKSPDNQQPYAQLTELLGDAQPKTCETKYGWQQGHHIGFVCKIELGGDQDIFKVISDGMTEERRVEALGFIHGLSPSRIVLDRKMAFRKEKWLFFQFKLQHHA